MCKANLAESKLERVCSARFDEDNPDLVGWEQDAAQLRENQLKEEHIALQRAYEGIVKAKNDTDARLKKKMSQKKAEIVSVLNNPQLL